MNREIKFRGKMLDSDDFVYGYYIHSELPNEIFEHKIYCADVNRLIDVKEETVGQFTELHDKNGKEIYEGDIVLLDCYYYEEPAFDGEFKVIYDDINGMWFLVDLENKDRGVTFGEIRSYYKAEIEVIGNIYEDIELLGGIDMLKIRDDVDLK